MDDDRALRIGELSRRTGVSPELLRAWERRYGLLRPTRSPGGLRLYGAADVERVRVMQQHLERGLAAAEAARAALRAPVAEDAAAPPPPPSLAALRGQLADALDAYDEPRAQAVLDRILSMTTLETLLGEIVLPYMHELGERWARGDASVAQEHFATALVRGRLLGLARGWGLGIGPAALLACLPGERHDLGLLAFGLALRAHGWRIFYLGPDSPLETVEQAAGSIDPSLVVLSAVSSEHLSPVVEQLRAFAGRRRLALGGEAAANLDLDGVLALTDDPVVGAERVAKLARDGAFAGEVAV